MTKLIGPERAQEAVEIFKTNIRRRNATRSQSSPRIPRNSNSFCRQRRIKAAVLTNKHGPHAPAACDHLLFSEWLSFTLGADDTEWKSPTQDSPCSLWKIGWPHLRYLVSRRFALRLRNCNSSWTKKHPRGNRHTFRSRTQGQSLPIAFTPTLRKLCWRFFLF